MGSEMCIRDRTITILLILLTVFGTTLELNAGGNPCPTLLNHNVKSFGSGQSINLCEAYQGKVIVIVNTANKCDLSEQYDALEALQDKFGQEGLAILGFHNNDYLGQMKGLPETSKEYCRLASSVRFPLFTNQRGLPENPTPIFRSLANAAGEYPQWNFHKYVIDREGELRGSFDSLIDPMDPSLTHLVKTLL